MRSSQRATRRLSPPSAASMRTAASVSCCTGAHPRLHQPSSPCLLASSPPRTITAPCSVRLCCSGGAGGCGCTTTLSSTSATAACSSVPLPVPRLLGRTLLAPGCATRSGWAAQPLWAQWDNRRLRCGREARPEALILRLSTRRGRELGHGCLRGISAQVGRRPEAAHGSRWI